MWCSRGLGGFLEFMQVSRTDAVIFLKFTVLAISSDCSPQDIQDPPETVEAMVEVPPNTI